MVGGGVDAAIRGCLIKQKGARGHVPPDQRAWRPSGIFFLPNERWDSGGEQQELRTWPPENMSGVEAGLGR